MEAASTADLDLSRLPAGLQIQVDDPAALEDPRMVAQLRELLETVRANPLLRYDPHVKQQPFHATRRKIKVFIGGERSGKTVAGVLDDLIQACDRSAVPDHLLPNKIFDPPFKCRLITPDFGQSYQEILRTLREWCPPAQLLHGDWEEAFSEKAHVLSFANGSFIEFMTQKQDVSQFGGTSRHRVHYDEEPKGPKGEEIRHANVNRLIQYRGDELFTFSPVHGFGFVGDNLWEARGHEVAPEVWVSNDMVLVRSDQDDNPHLDEAGKAEANAKLPARQREARKSGKLVHAEGLVYEEFNYDLHVCPRLDPEFVKGLEQMDCIDPGLNTAVLFAGFDSDNGLWIYDELFLQDSEAVPEHVAAEILKKRKEWGLPPRPKRTLIDPAAAARQSQTNKRTDRAYKAAGIRVRPAENDVDFGIYEVMRRYGHEDKGGNPQPLIQIAENCKGLIWETGRYRKERNDEDEIKVVKRDDHRVDCKRYLSAERPLPPIKHKPRALRETWVPGTAPPLSMKPQPNYGPMGKYS
ncbi:MAG TPA: hypothetical protein VF009_06965 [Solirubrobacterales bacterium]